MSNQLISIRSIVLAAPLLVLGLGIGVPANAAPADDCLAAPNSAAPKGSHWYYHTDRVKHRKCWFLRTLNEPPQNAAAQVTSSTAPAAQASTSKKPATASAGAPMPLTAAGDTPPLPPRRPQLAPTSGATTQEPVAQRFEDEKTAPPAPPAAQAAASTPASAPAAAPAAASTPAAAPAAASIWPDPPAVPTLEAQKPNPIPSDIPAAPVPAKATARVSQKSAGAAQDDASITGAAGLQVSAVPAPVKILLVLVLALAVAGFLYHFAMKMTARRSRRVMIDHPEPDWIDDRQQPEWRGDKHAFGNDRGKIVDDLHLSLVPAAGDYGARRPLPADDRRQDKARGNLGVSQTSDEVNERDKTLTQLIRDLDQLLQSRRQA